MPQTIELNCRRIFVFASLLGILGFVWGCTSAPLADYFALAESYQRVIASPLRTEQDRRMDHSRHPAELLSFTQVKPGMKVLDVSAGRGYTTQLLAIAVGAKRMVWAQAQRINPDLTKRLAEQPQSNVTVVQRPFDDPIAADAGKLDLVTVVLNELTKVGFVFDARGDFLRNPADSRAESSNNPKVPTDKFALRFTKP